MRRIIFWVILGGITLIAGVIVFRSLGTYWYRRSPARVVSGAFTHLLDAKSFNIALSAVDDAKDGPSFNVSGSVDKRALISPVADLKFSFQVPSRSFSGNGVAQAKDGMIYLRFDNIVGISNVPAGALASIWAGLEVNTLLSVASDRLFPEITTNFTEADLQAITAIAKRHIPFLPTGSETPVFVDNVLTTPYKVVLDRPTMAELFSEIKAAVKGSPLTDKEKAELAKTVDGLPPATGEIWVSRSDGTLREALLVFKGKSSSFHISARFNDYDKSVKVTAPVDDRPLIELIRRMSGASLSGVKLQLPFDLPVPILNINEKIPIVNGAPSTGKSGKNPGSLPNMLKLFYGTDQLFQKP